MKCPICKKEVSLGDADFPFCGERCRIIDLGNWAAGKYVVPLAVDDESDEDGSGAGGQGPGAGDAG